MILTRSLPCVTASVLAGCWTGSGAAPARAEPQESAAATPARRPRPRDACEVVLEPPVRATTEGLVRVVLPESETLTHLIVSSQGDGGLSAMSMHVGNALDGTAPVDPGVYVIEIGTARNQRVRCTDVQVAAGGVTTINVHPPAD